jgi:hypothetical protein
MTDAPILLTGDTLYPGRLYARDAPAFVNSIDRLIDFTRPRSVSHILGAHIENAHAVPGLPGGNGVPT